LIIAHGVQILLHRGQSNPSEAHVTVGAAHGEFSKNQYFDSLEIFSYICFWATIRGAGNEDEDQ
jgi:hypothetical protein